jgi:3',5'-cyclic AMP phosphodiesterase CpdA
MSAATGNTPAPLFRFVVVADTHVNEHDLRSSSPYATNQLANERARHVFEDIAAMDPPPAFVIHLGDIVHPVPSLPTFHDAVALFKEIAAPLTVPLHVLPGNHDVGDKRVDWMPADQVCAAYLDTYRAAFGPDYHAFDHGGVHGVRCVLLNSLLLNSGLPEEAQQREWAERQVDTAGERRVFLFMHYPPYIHRPDERSNYDNIDRPARDWLVALAARPGVEAVFAGHVHNFWYDRIGSAEFYMLPSTAFLRHDFTEFYRVAPKDEFGRGDVEKFGYFVVEIHRDGHVAHPVRTQGARLARGERLPAQPPRLLAHPKTSTFDQVGVELRHPWAESMQISATGGVQEFGRKWARNDYPLLALWEMGARLSKVPDIDLAEDESRSRMQLLARIGHRFLVTTIGAPGERLRALPLAELGVSGFETNFTLARFAQARDDLVALRQRTGCAVWWSKILTFDDDARFDGQHFSHFVKAGFSLDELDAREALVREALAAGAIDGITVRIESTQPLAPAARALHAFAARLDCRILASLKTSGASLAAEAADDRALVARTAQAMLLSKAGTRVQFVFDTFMDVDRGYYPRHGFIDRRYDPRPAAKAWACINALFSAAAQVEIDASPGDDRGGDPGSDSAPALAFTAQGRRWRLVTAPASAMRALLADCPQGARVIDLHDGAQRSLREASEHVEGEAGATLQVLLVGLDG